MARGALPPVRGFCKELKAIIAIITKETTERPRNPVNISINTSKRSTASDPAIAHAIRTTTDSARRRSMPKREPLSDTA